MPRACGIRELKASNRDVVHGQFLVRISLHASFSCRWPALIRGRSHPIRFANGAGSLYAIRSMERRVLPAGADSRSLAPHSLRELRRLLRAICELEGLVSPAGADSRALAPHSLRERDLARCSQRHLARCSQRYN